MNQTPRSPLFSSLSQSHLSSLKLTNPQRRRRTGLAAAFALTVLFTVGLTSSAQAAGFEPRVDYPAGNGATSVDSGDFNEDGILDLVTTNDDGGNISILLGSTSDDGTFQPKTDLAAIGGPVDATVGDFDGDGNLDIAAVEKFGLGYINVF